MSISAFVFFIAQGFPTSTRTQRRYVDPETEMSFFYDERSGKTSRTRPHEEAVEWFQKKNENRRTSVTRKSMFGRRRSSLRATLTDRTHTTNRRFGKDWIELVDRESGFTYYSNESTGETVWSLPPNILENKYDEDRLIEVKGEPIEAKIDSKNEDEENNKDVVQEIYAWGGTEFEPSEDCEWDQEREALVERKVNEQEQWEQVQDDDGNVYYFNIVTNESRWEKPDEFDVSYDDETAQLATYEVENVWESYVNEDGVEYWYNTRSGESQWVNPYAGQDEEKMDNVGSDDVWEIHEHDIHGTYYYNVETGESQWETPLCLMEEEREENNSENENWERHVDTDGNVYWYDVLSGESHWEHDLYPSSTITTTAEHEDDETPVNEIEEWETVQDEQGNTYYYNHTTGETSWEAPWIEEGGGGDNVVDDGLAAVGIDDEIE